ncbi:helix-turn-helix transcriptional regulator [Bradyrhizobium sp. Pear77]|uniref:AraC family transcriptional regulator n=1 Tax=Bradyrhizobium altum TaxID=1571202 RepID=UPI001E36AAFA|nr:AraC family transcriptional regulator [Bradyrhizobium altum]MCC8959803.1 helix-turn-helix transcriptional regulator [Bradyrhizobium altum]
MPQSSAYGEEFGKRLRARSAVFFRSLQNTNIAVTEVRSDDPEHGTSGSQIREDAFVVALQLVDYPVHEWFEDERVAPVTSLRAGETTIYDMKRNPQFTINNPFHSVHFYFPRAALNFIADGAEARQISELRYRPGVGVDDSTIRALVTSLMPAFDHPEQASRVFVEHVTMAVGIHAAKTYGGMQLVVRPLRGGLAPWQMRRTEETLAANLQGDVSLADLANDCGVSLAHFSRAFRRSTGLSPHQWLLKRRVDEAKGLLRDRTLSLSDVALSCGFADQPHFTRVFAKLTGLTPGAWRRNLQ